jgi:hypothetical protein
MPGSRIPDPLERRHLIERDLPAARALEIAEAYLAEERAAEAVVFLAKAGAHDRLAQLADAAVEAGDVFLLTEIGRARGVDPEPEVWERLAEAARRAGKQLYAETALRQAHRGEA